MRHPVPNIRLKLRAILEPRSPLASTLVEAEGEQRLVLTLTPLKTARLVGRSPRTAWETRVYTFDARASVGLGGLPRYAVLSASQPEALARHEALVVRIEAGTFETETAREVLAPIRPLMDRAVEQFRLGNYQAAVAVLEEAIRVARHMDVVHSFLHLYQEAFLMRALVLECIHPDTAKAAYREFIQLYAGLASHHPETLRGVARAREAIERLTPTPREGSTRPHVQQDANPA
jgi:hypothetical protein